MGKNLEADHLQTVSVTGEWIHGFGIMAQGSSLIAVLSELNQEMCQSPFGAGRPSLAGVWRE